MKGKCCWLILTGLFSGILPLKAKTEFDPGGVTFNFAEISNRRFLTSATGDNLFGEWLKSPPWVHIRDGKLAGELRAKITPFVEFTMEKTVDGVFLKTLKKKEIEEIAGSNASSTSGSWRQHVNLPDNTGGRYSVSFQYKSTYFGKFGSGGFVILLFENAAGKSLGSLVKPFTTGSGTWQSYICDFDVPAGTEKLTVLLRLDGCGEIIYKTPRLVKSKVQYPATVILAPGALLDDTFALSRNDPAVLTFAWRRDVPKEQWKLNDPVLHVKLPPGVIFKEAAPMLDLKEFKNGEYLFSLKRVKNRLVAFDGFDTHLLLPMMLTTDSEPGTKFAPASYWLTDAGKQISEKKEFTFIVIPRIREAAKSELYLNGYYLNGLYLNFANDANAEFWAQFIGRTGSRWLVGDPDSRMTELYRKYGIDMITPELYWIANGYRIGEPKGKPDYVKYKPIGKTNSFDVQNGTCPTAIYRKTDYFKNSIVPYLEKKLKGTDGLIANWEPYMFHGMGCFCDNCRDEFAVYAGMSKKDAAKVWPQELLINHKYYELGVRFRSWQHAQLIKTIHEAVLKVTTGKAGFIPEVAWIHMVDCPARKSAAGEHDPLDYAGDLKYIDPWGPYITWKSLEPYTYAKGDNLNTYIAAKRVVDFTRKNLPDGKRPKLLALPHGMQGDFWVTNPEAIGMEVLGFFLAGYDASTVYLFPKGYDNRYWAEQAHANNLIARHEKTVCLGEKVNSVTVEPLTPFPAPKKRINHKYFSDIPPKSLLQAAAFRKDGLLLTAVGNFWEKGDAFFKLKAGGLGKSGRYIVLEPERNRAFVNASGTGFSGAELEAGVVLHVGALRWAFFEILPWNPQKNYTNPVFPAEVVQAMKERVSELKTEVDAEAKRDEAEEKGFRESELKSMTCGKLECKPVKTSDGAQALDFVSGRNFLRLVLTGMAVQSWKIGETELIAGGPCTGLGAPAFWQPPVQVEDLFLVVEQRKTDRGLLITAEKILGKKNSPALEHLAIRQTLEVGESLETVAIRTELINRHDAESGLGTITEGFRYHILPLFWGQEGSIEMLSNGARLDIKRRQERTIFARGTTPASAAMKKLFEAPGIPVVIDNNSVTWHPAKVDFKVRMTVEPAESLAGYASWDTPNLKAPTFEPFFHPITLQAGKKTEVSLKLQVER